MEVIRFNKNWALTLCWQYPKTNICVSHQCYIVHQVLQACSILHNLQHYFFIFYFFPKKTPSISYKSLQMSYVQIPVGMWQFHLMWKPTDSRKGEDDHCWMKAIRCLSTPSEPPLRPSYWLFRVATISLHISSSNIVGCVDWLETTRLYRCFHTKYYIHVNIIPCDKLET